MSLVSGEPARRVVVSGLMAMRKGVRLAALGLRTLLQILLALLIVLEEWGWRPLADGLARLARWRPWAAVEHFVSGLPPYLALIAFVLPSGLLLPLKFLALILIGKGYYVTSVALFLFAKAVATALVARLFMLTQPALMSIGWFAWGYNTLMPWKDALTAKVRSSLVWRIGRAVKWRMQRTLRPIWLGLKPRLLALAATAREGGRQTVQRLRAMLGW